MSNIQLMQGDCLEYLKDLPDSSAKSRSKTFQGIAAAIAQQYSAAILSEEG